MQMYSNLQEKNENNYLSQKWSFHCYRMHYYTHIWSSTPQTYHVHCRRVQDGIATNKYQLSLLIHISLHTELLSAPAARLCQDTDRDLFLY